MRTVTKPQFHIVIPVMLAAGGVTCGWYLLTELRFEAPVAWVVAAVLAVAGVLLAAMQRQVNQCESCLRLEPMSPEDEGKWVAQDKATERERMRGDLETEIRAALRPAIEQELRPSIEQQVRPLIEQQVRPAVERELRPRIEREVRAHLEDELRPQLAEELRAQFVEELRPQLMEEVRTEVEREAEARLRPKIEAQVRAALARSATPGSAPAPLPKAPPPIIVPTAGSRPPASAESHHTSAASQPGAMEARSEPAPAAMPPGTVAPAGAVTDPHARAQRRARVIISDIQLYNRELIEKAARSNDPKKMLESVWVEAVNSYNDAVPSEVRKNTNYLGDALDALMTKMRKE